MLAMPPPSSSASTRPSKCSSTANLSETFAPPRTAMKGARGSCRRRRERGLFALKKQTGVARQQIRDADSRGMGAMSGAERVVDEEIAEPGQAGGEIGSLASSPDSKRVFSSRRTRRDCSRGGRASASGPATAETVATGRPSSSLSRARNWADGIRGVRLPLRPPQMRREHDRRASVQQVLNRGQRGANAGVVGHFAFAQGHVEIDPDQRSLTANVGLGDRPLRHGGCSMRTETTMRGYSSSSAGRCPRSQMRATSSAMRQA